MQALADSYQFWILLFAVLVVVYLLPALIGMIRGVDQLALVLLVNLIGADRRGLAGGDAPGLQAATASARAVATSTQSHAGT